MEALEILASTRRVSLSPADMSAIRGHLERTCANGLDLSIVGAATERDVWEMMGAGLITFRSSALKTDIILVNADAGKGFFGGQKTQILTYTSDIDRDEYSPGPVLDSLIRALVGINNMYRGAGLLKGGAF